MTSEWLAEQLVTFAESGNQQRIQLLTGQVIQGWIMEITDTALQISAGFNDNKSSADFWVDFDQLDLNQLYYWDIKQDNWQQFQLPAQS